MPDPLGTARHAEPTVTPDLGLPVGFADVISASDRLAGVARRTPVLTSRQADARCNAEVFFKAENFQRVGAFKFRGAYNALGNLDQDTRERGVLTYSSGNHAQAIALAGALLGIPTLIVMPSDAPRAKLDATAAYIRANPATKAAPDRCRILEYDRETTTRETLGASLSEQFGLPIIPPYDHPDVIAGQGTAALELFEDNGELDALYVCCGGGGLLSGCAVAARGCAGQRSAGESCRVVGCEPELADDAARSFRTGMLHTVENPPTIADGARTPSLGTMTFPIVRALVDEFVTVSERDIARAVRFCLERMKLVVEPSGVLGLAALFRTADEQPELIAGKRIGVVISGGNVDLAQIPAILALAE